MACQRRQGLYIGHPIDVLCLHIDVPIATLRMHAIVMKTSSHPLDRTKKRRVINRRPTAMQDRMVNRIVVVYIEAWDAWPDSVIV